MGFLIAQAILVTLLAVGSYVLAQRVRNNRSAIDVLEDLTFDGPHVTSKRGVRARFTLGDELFKIGLFSEEARRRHELKGYLKFPLAVALASTALTMLQGASVKTFLLSLVIGLALGNLLRSRHRASQHAFFVSQLEFFLPLVMERLVMAIQAGHDIISGVRTVIALEKDRLPQDEDLDPVTSLLEMTYRLTEKGARFDEAVQAVAEAIDCTAFRHAMVHLALAHKDGGELQTPLRELCDATQTYYQESVEEEIAKLPVKATAPLALTFAGLVIAFLVNPVNQVAEMTSKYSKQGEIKVSAERK